MRASTKLLLVLFALVLVGIFYDKKEQHSTHYYIEEYTKLMNDIPQEDRARYLNGAKSDRPDLAARREFLMTMSPKYGRPTPEKLFEIQEKIRKKPGQYLKSKEQLQLTWDERGPNNVGGRTRAILIDANDPSGNTVWAGSVSGGLWKTTNFLSASAMWERVDDFLPGLSISAIVQDPNNPDRMYFSTGEGHSELFGFGGRLSRFQGFGLWKSTDGGRTWNVLHNDFDALNYGYDLDIDERGDLYYATSIGIYRYFDNDDNWSHVLGVAQSQGKANTASDIEFASDGTKYATLHGNDGERSRDRASGQIFRSSGPNSGHRNTWVEITPERSLEYGRIEIDVSPSNPNRIIALCNTLESDDVTHIFRSDNKGDAWVSLDVPTIVDQTEDPLERPLFTRGQALYDLIAKFDPNDDDVIFIGGVDLLRSTDAGESWKQISVWTREDPEIGEGFSDKNVLHADQHVIEFMQSRSSRVILANDGGIYISENFNRRTSNPTYKERNNGYHVTQYYACAVSDFADDDFFMAGSQDNGTHAFFDPGINDEVSWWDGDGAYCFFSENSSTSIFSTQLASYYSWNSVDEILTTVINEEEFGSFINPADYDPEFNILIAGRDINSIYIVKSADTPNPEVDNIEVPFEFTTNQMTISPYNTSTQDYRIYVGTFDGDIAKVYKISDVLGSNPQVTDISGTQLPFGFTSSIQFGEDENTILVTMSNYGVESIWLTKDGGQSWKNVSGNIPDFPIRWAIFDPNSYDRVYLATQLGVWSTDNINANNVVWRTSNNGLANVRVDMLRIRKRDNLVLAATHGRGLFTSNDLMDQCGTFAANITVQDASCFEEADGKITVNPSGGSGTYEVRFGTEGDFRTNNNVLEDILAGTYVVQVRDANGCTASEEVVVRQPNPLGLEFTQDIDATSSVTVAVTGGTPGYAYRWNDSQSQTTSTASNLVAGVYEVTVTDANGCTSTATTSVSTTTSLYDPELLDHVKVFPNPTSDFVHVEIDDKYDFESLQIVDVRGRVVVYDGNLMGFRNKRYNIEATLKTPIY